MLIYLRSALFLVWFLSISLVLNIASLPLLVVPRRAAVWMANKWARLVLFGLKHICGVDMVVRGRVPSSTSMLIAAKHFSIWETIAVLALLRDPAIVLKRELLWIPLYGWYCTKMAMIPINRSSGAGAIRRMHAAAKRAVEAGRPVVIFPEGTRKKPGEAPDYKPGVAALYAQLGIPCVPLVHNSGLFWAGWFLRRPGTIMVEHLEAIPPGLPKREFMSVLESRMEEATARLLRETPVQINLSSVKASEP
jgi:1-acyl-sn-glycerol-3-phosphate acyltransferase